MEYTLGKLQLGQKDKLMKSITKAFKDIEVDTAGLTIIIHDIPRYNWAKGGEQVSKEKPKPSFF